MDALNAVRRRAGGHHAAPPASQQSTRAVQHQWIVVDDDNELSPCWIELGFARRLCLNGFRQGGR
jgi:hypothetical protein